MAMVMRLGLLGPSLAPARGCDPTPRSGATQAHSAPIKTMMASRPCEACMVPPPRSLQTVERLGIRPENLLDRRRAHLAAVPEIAKGVDLRRRVIVAVICPDHQIVLPRVLQNVGEVIVSLTRDEQPIVPEYAGPVVRLSTTALDSARRVVDRRRHPLSGRLDEADSE